MKAKFIALFLLLSYISSSNCNPTYILVFSLPLKGHALPLAAIAQRLAYLNVLFVIPKDEISLPLAANHTIIIEEIDCTMKLSQFNNHGFAANGEWILNHYKECLLSKFPSLQEKYPITALVSTYACFACETIASALDIPFFNLQIGQDFKNEYKSKRSVLDWMYNCWVDWKYNMLVLGQPKEILLNSGFLLAPNAGANVHTVGVILREEAISNSELNNFLQTQMNITVIVFSSNPSDKSSTVDHFNQIISSLKHDPLIVITQNSSISKSLLSMHNEKSILIVDFAPLQAILSHSRVVSIINHCGSNSVAEAVHFKKPIICLPQRFDQYQNCKLVQDLKLGLCLSKMEDLSYGRQEVEKMGFNFPDSTNGIDDIEKIVLSILQ